MEQQYDFFISYSRDIYSEIVDPIIECMERLGFNIWVDRTEVVLGMDIYKNINKVMGNIHYWRGAIVIIDKTYLCKEWCKLESDFLINNNVYCCPILYKITKNDLINDYVYYKNLNLATVKSLQDLPLAVDKILMSYINSLAPLNNKINISSSLLSAVTLSYKHRLNNAPESFILSDVICQIIEIIQPNFIFNNHSIEILKNIIHFKTNLLYKTGTYTRYDNLLLKKAINYILNQIEVS